MKRIAIFISGNGSNLQALINACAQQHIAGHIVAVLSDQQQAYGLQRAQRANIPALFVNPADYPNREAFDQHLIKTLIPYQVDLIVLAGFMRILTPPFVTHYQHKILNIHPSLLPNYPGLNTHQRVLTNHDTQHGSSIHFVTVELDGGPLILQADFTISSADTELTLTDKVKTIEHQIYPKVVNWFCQDRLTVINRTVWFDGLCLPSHGIQQHFSFPSATV